jgi:integrase
MGKLSDVQIRTWIRAGERFEGRSDGGGLWLRYRSRDATPVWRFRYSIAGKARVINLGSYRTLSLAEARRTARELSARVALGYDPAGEKAARRREAVAKIEAARHAVTVGDLADQYFEKMILGRWKHPNIVRSRIEKDIRPAIGKLAIEDVKPAHIDRLLQTIVQRGAPTIANDVLRWLRRIFAFGIKRHILTVNPAAAFDLNDAGGQEKPRDRALSREELVSLFAAMRAAKGFSRENELTVKLLLLLAVRKQELTGARWEEFDLDGAVWHLPAERTKTSAALDIPLPVPAVDCLRELHRLACGSAYVLPARKAQARMLPHIAESTISAALGKVRPHMPGSAAFTTHDLRRTARTHLAALGVDAHIAERCLNHRLKGVEGIYNRHDYFEERQDALNRWAKFLVACEAGDQWNVVPLRGTKEG